MTAARRVRYEPARGRDPHQVHVTPDRTGDAGAIAGIITGGGCLIVLGAMLIHAWATGVFS